MGSNNKNFDTITGRYLLIDNPCTTVPCLPGLAYAILANEKYYYITIDGHWFSQNISWNGYTPELEDIVTVTGFLEEKKDAFGKLFHTIEAISLQETK
jgi:hypothetical protein